jgi:hypothetical protein
LFDRPPGTNDVPAWPLSNELTPDSGLLGHAFESVDLAPIPGFEGTPFNLLIAIVSPKGILPFYVQAMP